MAHLDLELLAAGDALEDLDGPERLAFGRHAAACSPCRALALDLEATLAELALLAPPRAAPAGGLAELRAAIRSADRGRADQTRRGGSARPASPGRLLRRASLPGRFPLAVAAVLVAAVAGFGLRDVTASSELAAARDAALRATTQAELAGREAAVAVARAAAASGADGLAEARLREALGLASVAVDVRHRVARLGPEPLAPAAAATVLYEPGTDRAYLVAEGLPATPPGRVYQLWVADAAGVHALGTYPFAGSGPFVASFGLDLAGRSAAMVTLEAAGGATGAPGPQVVFGPLPAS
ncbi:MAG TPA: anti-sigma factor [Candidatus Limnocylindrales bacterium]